MSINKIFGGMMVICGIIVLIKGKAGRTIAGIGEVHELEFWQVIAYSVLLIVFGLLLLIYGKK